MKRMFTEWPPILSAEDWNPVTSELCIRPLDGEDPEHLPPRLLVNGGLLTAILLWGNTNATFSDPGTGDYVGGILRINHPARYIYQVKAWKRSIRAFYCEWPD